MRHAYPMMLDVSERLVVIVGGGAVAARKAWGVAEAEARHVRVVASEFRADFPRAVERVGEPYGAGHLRGAGLAFAATDDPAVNDAVVRDARALGILVSRADGDADDPGDFVTPARFREGPVTVAVSAGSAALAVVIRNGLARRFDKAWARMATAMQALRPAVLASGAGLPAERRAHVFRDLATDEAFGVLAERGEDGLREWLRRRYPELQR